MIHRPLADDAEPQGRVLWRSLDELADTDEFRDFLVREFPSTMPEFQDPNSRRQFLRVMGASLALAGVAGCTHPAPEKIVPYVEQPERVKPGNPLFFASAVPLNGYATGVLVESHTGRPTRIEGNPNHPASLGAVDSFAQAAVLDLYDPDRSKVVTHNGRVSTYDDFLAVLVADLEKHKKDEGKGIRILTGSLTSPTLIAQIQGLLGQAEKPEAKPDSPEPQKLNSFSQARWYVHEPTESLSGRLGTRMAFGRELDPIYHFENADVIVSLDADFLSWSPSRLVDARNFASRREPGETMNRLHVVEPSPTITGAMADHRLAAKPSRIAAIASQIGAAIAGDSRPEDPWAARVAEDLKAHRGKGLVLAGNAQPPEIHAIAHNLNHALGNVGKGKTVEYIEPVGVQMSMRHGNREISANRMDEGPKLADLAREIDDGHVSLLVVLGCNPAYDAPADLNFAEKIRKVPSSIHLGTHVDETAVCCHWHIPEAHCLETWGDLRAFDGTATIQQPLINPLYGYGGKTAIELISAMRGRPDALPMNLVRETWQASIKDDFDEKWRAALYDGVVADSAAKPVEVSVKRALTKDVRTTNPSQGLEIIFRPDATIWDGRFSNNAWLQELPKPLSKLTWDNAALVSQTTADRLLLKNEQVVELSLKGRTLKAAIWINPGQADDVISLSLGYGRTNAGRVGTGQGFNAYALRTSDAPWHSPGLGLAITSETYDLATTQHHWSMHGRDMVRIATKGEYAKDPNFAKDKEEIPPPGLTLYPPDHPYDGYKWGMSINLATCIGCNACVTACQSENNCPVVGKDQVLRGRELHWIRIDRYYEGDPKNPTAIYHQPVPCMQCENAPCELVCPVNATVHDDEGLNVMVYNRCVGTRYCSNNCPYKVRRFNFYQYSDQKSETMKLLNNPEVSVRTRGVMEKCTYCVQRIVNRRVVAEEENRTLRDGEVITACQAACPTRAIVFGDLNNKASEVVKKKAERRDYALLSSLNTKPRTTYLAKITNPKEA